MNFFTMFLRRAIYSTPWLIFLWNKLSQEKMKANCIEYIASKKPLRYQGQIDLLIQRQVEVINNKWIILESIEIKVNKV